MRRALVLGAVMLVAASVRVHAADGVRMIDAHSQVARSVGWDKALALLAEAGIERVILSPLRTRDVRPFLEFATSHRDRIIPAIGLKPDRLREGDRAALDRLARMGRLPVFGALSEVMILHAQKGTWAPEIVSSFDSPYARTALAIALQRHWPFVVHIEFGFARDSNRYDTYMSRLESLLRRHPDLPVVLSHMGQLDVDGARRLIAAYPNIFFLTSHANPIFIADHHAMGGRQSMGGRRSIGGHGSDQPWTELFSGERLAAGWRDLFIAHPDRFILAFDNVYDQDWSSHYVRQARLWRSALADLPEAVANAVAHGNAERLWHLSGGE